MNKAWVKGYMNKQYEGMIRLMMIERLKNILRPNHTDEKQITTK